MLTAAMALESWKDLFSSREEPALDKQKRMFSNRQLRQMLVPLFIEQILVVGLGLSDTFMVSFLGEAAVSGVALLAQVILRWETQTNWRPSAIWTWGNPRCWIPMIRWK